MSRIRTLTPLPRELKACDLFSHVVGRSEGELDAGDAARSHAHGLDVTLEHPGGSLPLTVKPSTEGPAGIEVPKKS